MTTHDEYGLLCTHWTLGGLVLIGLAASEYSGAGTVVALPVSAITVSFSAICGLYYTSKSSPKRRLGDVIHFLIIWLNILELLMAAATCARVASATIDYTSEEKLRVWLFGLESHSLGEPWPDVLGVTIIAVISTLFMLGLEKSSFFCVLLYVVITTAFTFFVGVGGYHTDIKFWNWTEDFKLRSWGYILITAAVCSYGFANCFPQNGGRYFKITAYIFVPFICYVLIALIFTFMSHYREIAGTAIPLVRVFEVRDVGWARLVMAVCTICVVCVVLTEIMPPLYDFIMELAGKEWHILLSPILYRSTLTGAPILAIFTAGSLSSILAFACPLTYLVRLLNISFLLKCALKSTIVLFDCYKSNFQLEEYLARTSNVQYSKLNQDTHSNRSAVRPVKSIIPRYMWPKRSPADRSHNIMKKKDTSEDKEYLLLDQYGSNSLDNYDLNETSSESDGNVSTPVSDADESSSSTDIDAVVQEYKDKIQVTTSNNFPEEKPLSILSTKILLIIVFVVFITSALLSRSISTNNSQLAWLTIIILCLCLVLICLMPQYTSEDLNNTSIHCLIPHISLLAIILNVLLATTLLVDIWPGLLFWILSGLILFCRCGWCSCDDSKERVIIYRRTDCSITDIPNEEKIIDTVVIPR